MQYILFNLYKSEIAEILGVSQSAPGLVLLSPVYGANWDIFLAPAVTVGETEGAMDSASVFFLPLLLPITF